MSVKRVAPLCSKQFVIAIDTGRCRKKVFQVIFDPKGDFYVPLPYVRTKIAAAHRCRVRGTGESRQTSYLETTVLSSGQTKFAYHVSGETHVSGNSALDRSRQDLRILSIPIVEAVDDLFTVLVQNFDLLDDADPIKDRDCVTKNRSLITLYMPLGSDVSVRFLARVYKDEQLFDMAGGNPEDPRPLGPVGSFSIPVPPIDSPIQLESNYVALAPFDRARNLFADRVLVVFPMIGKPIDADSDGLVMLYGGYSPMNDRNDLRESFDHLAIIFK
jgi:hypothetical protein